HSPILQTSWESLSYKAFRYFSAPTNSLVAKVQTTLIGTRRFQTRFNYRGDTSPEAEIIADCAPVLYVRAPVDLFIATRSDPDRLIGFGDLPD
ncbi:hypothetical protein, partial [Mesorhizobium sp. L2C066B000]|uniref:hypothetical protein n=1 Tax=Mesorhizobium sp. L2C066B000 TaxID=1287105 RepID=UPI001AEC6FD6